MDIYIWSTLFTSLLPLNQVATPFLSVLRDSLRGTDLLGSSEGHNPSGRPVVHAAHSCPAHLDLPAGSPVQW